MNPVAWIFNAAEGTQEECPACGGDAALVVDPERPDRIADTVHRIGTESGLREELIRRGLRRVEGFSWERMAKLTLQARQEAVYAGH